MQARAQGNTPPLAGAGRHSALPATHGRAQIIPFRTLRLTAAENAVAEHIGGSASVLCAVSDYVR